MSRLPIRVKLTIAFAVAMAAVLVLAGAFVYLRVHGELNDSIDEGLLNRAEKLDEAVAGGAPEGIELGTREDPEDSFSLVVAPDGKLVDSTSAGDHDCGAGAARGSYPAPPGGGTDVGTMPGLDGQARVVARNVASAPRIRRRCR